MSEDTHCLNYAYSSSLFTLKSNILAQNSDKISLPHSINLLFGLRGPGSILILDSSQIWSLQEERERKTEKHRLFFFFGSLEISIECIK